MRIYPTIVVVLTVCIMWLHSEVSAADEPPMRPRSPNHTLSLLDRPSLRKELELTTAQMEEVILLEVDRQRLFQSPLGRLNQPTIEERKAAYAEFQLQLGELEKRAFAILLPPQRKRLDQILLQKEVGVFEPSGGVTHPRLAPRLGLVEPQLEAVRQAAIAAEKEFNARMEELIAEINKARDAARNKVLAELTPEQRATYEELVGKPFDLKKLE